MSRACVIGMSWLAMAILAATAFATRDASIDVAEPAAGGSSTASSQPLGDSSKVAVSVRNSAGDLKASTIVGEGGSARTGAGDAVAACWLIGPEAIPVKSADVREFLAEERVQKRFRNASAKQTMSMCIGLVTALGLFAGGDSKASSSAGGCRVQSVALRVRRRGGRSVVSPAGKRSRRPTVRYRCSGAGRGAVRIAVTGGRAGGALRRQLGPRLDLGVVRHRDAPKRRAKMTIGFGLR